MSEILAFGLYSEACSDAFSMLALSPEVAHRILGVDPTQSEFTPIGQVALGGDDMLIHAGLKTTSYDCITRVALEMQVGDRLLRYQPSRFDSLPLFTLPAANTDGETVGILTEDYTQEGTLELVERRHRFRPFNIRRHEVPEGLYLDVYDSFEGRVYSEAFGHMMGWVGHREVMVDFDDIAFPDQAELVGYVELAEALTLVAEDLGDLAVKE
ncbi:hypothetical protein KA047_01620 [Candidatus Saccharibacteria bacterium]|nr:hypothetical protein [Candidatus Saccharibacteria bacterium]